MFGNNNISSYLNSPAASSFTVKPLRAASAIGTGNVLIYNTNSGELGYSTATTTTNKSFIIDHPTKPDNYLVHTCLEGPEIGVYYRGKNTVVDIIEINLPDYVNALATNFTVHLTPIENFAELYASKVKHGKFKVYSNKYCEFNWVVYATRGSIEVEPLKATTKIKGDGPYRWI